MYALLSLTHLWNFISISSLEFLRPPKLLRQQSTAVKTAQFDHGKQFLFLIYCWPPKPLSQQSTVIKTARFDHGKANFCLNSLFYFVRLQNLLDRKARWSKRRDLTTGGQIDHGISNGSNKGIRDQRNRQNSTTYVIHAFFYVYYFVFFSKFAALLSG